MAEGMRLQVRASASVLSSSGMACSLGRTRGGLQTGVRTRLFCSFLGDPLAWDILVRPIKIKSQVADGSRCQLAFPGMVESCSREPAGINSTQLITSNGFKRSGKSELIIGFGKDNEIWNSR